MQGSGARGVRLATAVCAVSLLLLGCGGGNRLISNRDGLVESGELVLDSIPRYPAESEYIIGSGDVLDVIFPYDPDFDQVNLPVRPDGRITVPHVGEVIAAGKTAAMLDSLITARYAEIMVEPDIAVVVKEFAEQVIYVLGEVKAPGGFPYDRNLTLLGAVALGSGPTDKAALSNVLVIRKVGPSHVIGIEVDYGDIAGGKRFDLNVPLEAGDIVLVPKSKLGATQDFVKILYGILMNPTELYIKGWQAANAKVYYDYYRRIGMQQ